jgi:hypothetical protein
MEKCVHQIAKRIKGILIAFILIHAISLLSAPSSSASAGWYPVQRGKELTVEFCLPNSAPNIYHLQASSGNDKWITVAVIQKMQLSVDLYCKDDFKFGNKQGLFHLKYKWTVNLSGGWALRLSSQRTNSIFYGWPDGVSASSK